MKVLIFLIIISLVSCNKKPQEIPLKDAFKDHFLIGAAINYQQIMKKDTIGYNLLKKHFNSITAENIMKWEEIHPRPGVYNFAPADSFVALGQSLNMFIVGHTLVWHNQTPRWVFEDEKGKPVCRDTLLKRMRDHIYTVVGRYKGKVKGWDVVNEALNEDGTLRKSKWLEIIGEDYIEKAFQYAHEADPDAELYYNDYNMPKPSKRDGAIAIVKRLKEKNIRIDGIGMQGHYDLKSPKVEDFEESIKKFSELGVKVMITEMDIDVLPGRDIIFGAEVTVRLEGKPEFDPYKTGLPDSMQVVLANRYKEFFEVLLKHSDKVSRVTFWGVHDGQSWLNYWPVRGRTNHPLIFDRQGQPKLVYYTLIDLAKNYKK